MNFWNSLGSARVRTHNLNLKFNLCTHTHTHTDVIFKQRSLPCNENCFPCDSPCRNVLNLRKPERGRWIRKRDTREVRCGYHVKIMKYSVEIHAQLRENLPDGLHPEVIERDDDPSNEWMSGKNLLSGKSLPIQKYTKIKYNPKRLRMSVYARGKDSHPEIWGV